MSLTHVQVEYNGLDLSCTLSYENTFNESFKEIDFTIEKIELLCTFSTSLVSQSGKQLTLPYDMTLFMQQSEDKVMDDLYDECVNKIIERGYI